MSIVTLRTLHIGHGIPKVIVPISETSREGILAMGKKLCAADADAAEWRVDFYEGLKDTHDVLSLLCELRSCLGNKPLIFTCRTAGEGGMADISDEEYALLNRAVLQSGPVDAIDIEVFSHGQYGAELIRDIGAQGCVSVGSRHMDKMPETEELTDTLKAIHSMGADITKLAAAAENPGEALALMRAARQAKASGIGPLIAIAMGEQGIMSRVLAELMGSDAVFAAVGRGTAAGQLSLGAMKAILKTVHENII